MLTHRISVFAGYIKLPMVLSKYTIPINFNLSVFIRFIERSFEKFSRHMISEIPSLLGPSGFCKTEQSFARYKVTSPSRLTHSLLKSLTLP